jgi:transcriptional regulator of acetoin/glycerol metabolism
MAFRPPGLSLRFISRFTDRRTQRSAWETFITRHQLLPNVPAVIGRSWTRCWTLLDPHQSPVLSRLGSDHLLSTQVANVELMLIARPIMEDIYQYIEDSDTAVVITNSAGYILDIIGDESILDKLKVDGIDRGISLAENQMGTNAFALATLERMPVLVVGPDHYMERFHEYSDAAAPIFDPSGNLLGALGIIYFHQQHHAHSLGFVLAGAKAIEGQRQSDLLLDEQNRQLAGLNAILFAIDEGILVWNHTGTVIHANLAATRILNLSMDNLMGENIENHVQFPRWVQQAIAQNKTITGIEANLGVGTSTISCVLSLRYIPAGRGSSGVIVILRSAKDVRQLVHRQVGAQAAFSLDNLVGTSQSMRRLRRTAETAAAARASILVRGESGTGKNLLARAIHNHGPQSEGPFIVFACNAIPSELMLTELVGIEESVVNARISGRPGKLELADGGTIFFKDVEWLPLDAQTILLNVLELGIVQRLGSRSPVNVQVRVIASTSANLEELVEQGNFRADLYYRLSPFEIHIPPLRDRMDDLPLLVNNILERINRYQLTQAFIAPETLEILSMYHWPGNVRELEGVLERASALADGHQLIQPEHLPDSVRAPERQISANQNMLSMEELERQAIIQAAQACRGNISHMARVLGIGRTTVWRRMKQLNISPDLYREN